MAIHVKEWPGVRTGTGKRNKFGAIRVPYCLRCATEVLRTETHCPLCSEKLNIFASKREFNRYKELRILEAFGDIKDLKLQPEYPMIVNGNFICTYIADFIYTTREGNEIVEDSKGMRTSVYKIKKKLMKALYNIDVLET